ncbi:carboxylating nicotinate-nucleotide diphosphorylase [Dehalococcoidia bacterium]|nr:carboxylating nicotinate-nucleotide diphosphorylase [Dehalococcoidia bacterium]MCL0101621.1 carboxylating nicotinate-nucleotide diphosphorylase [Dehalococcoidia bacterium]
MSGQSGYELLMGLDEVVRSALQEDAYSNDVTTLGLIDAKAMGKAVVLAKEAGVVAGLGVAAAVFHRTDAEIRFAPALGEGAAFSPDAILASVEGHMHGILMGERVALNFLQRLSGIASETRRYVEAVDGTGAKILDTRKTTPGLRKLEKYAVRMGGALNHRVDLSQSMLVKDNHIAILRQAGRTLAEIVRQALANTPVGKPVEIEVASLAEVCEAIEAGARRLLLDNMFISEMREAVKLAKSVGCVTEASGGITLESVRPVAETGVDFISVGALTHSVKAIDISLELES